MPSPDTAEAVVMTATHEGRALVTLDGSDEAPLAYYSYEGGPGGNWLPSEELPCRQSNVFECLVLSPWDQRLLVQRSYSTEFWGRRLFGEEAMWMNGGLSKPTEAPSAQARLTQLPNGLSIRFGLDNPGHVRVAVLNALGQRVQVLHDGYLTAGVHSITWDWADHHHLQSPNGTYFITLDIGLRRTVLKAIRH